MLQRFIRGILTSLTLYFAMSERDTESRVEIDISEIQNNLCWIRILKCGVGTILAMI